MRTNRFVDHARFDSVTDRVRAAGGRVFIAADGLDWMRRMHGRDGDGGSDAPGALDAPLDETLARWRAADPPALLIVHFVDTDATAHASGVRSDAHRRAVDAADALVGRIADAETATLFLLSDHGHRDAGGHGGDEPEVAFSPLLVRAPGVTRGARIPVPIDPDTLAPSIALALGVPRPRAALGEALSELVGDAPADPWPLRAGSIAHAIREHARRMLSSRREWLVPVLGLLVFALLGPIKRGFGFDRSLLAVPLGPALVVAGHLAIGPLSLSAIDERGAHAARGRARGARVPRRDRRRARARPGRARGAHAARGRARGLVGVRERRGLAHVVRLRARPVAALAARVLRAPARVRRGGRRARRGRRRPARQRGARSFTISGIPSDGANVIARRTRRTRCPSTAWTERRWSTVASTTCIS